MSGAGGPEPERGAGPPAIERPLLVLVVGLLPGIVAGRSALLSLGQWMGLFAACGAVALGLVLRRRTAAAVRCAAVVVAAFCFGGAFYQGRQALDGWDRLDVRGGGGGEAVLSVRGVVIESPVALEPTADPVRAVARQGQPAERRAVMLVSARRVIGTAGDRTVRAGPRLHCRLSVVVNGPPQAFRPGQWVDVTGEYSAPRGPANPGEPDRASVAAREGVAGSLFAAGPSAVRRVRPRGWTDRLTVLSCLPERISDCLRRRTQALNGGSAVPLATALVMGDRRALGQERREAFRLAGTMHFIAISGLHLGLVAIIAWVGFTVLGVPHKPRHAAVLAVVWAYATVSGLHESTLRAAGMISLFLAAPLTGRLSDRPTAFAAGVLAVLLARPAQIDSAGFHMSAGAVWAILYIHPGVRQLCERRRDEPRSGRIRRIGGWPVRFGRPGQVLLVSLTVWAVLAPYLAAMSRCVTPVAPLATVILMPLMTLILALGMIGFAVIPFSDLGGWLIVKGLAGLSELVDTIIEWFKGLPGAHVWVAGPSVWWMLAFYAWVGLWAVRRRLRVSREAMVAAGLVLLGLYLLDSAHERARWRGRGVLCDVGRGLSFVALGRESGTLVFDAGADNPVRALSAVSGVLWNARVRTISWLVLSHPDADHVNAVPALLERFRVANLLVPRGFGESPAGRLVLSLAARRGVRVHEGLAGDGLFGRSYLVECVHPPLRFCAIPGVPVNERSLVCRFEGDGLSVLLTGDVEETGTGRLVDLARSWREAGRSRVDVLVLPHHGEPLREAVALAEAVRPGVAAVSGERRFAPGALGVPILATADCGALLFRREGGTILVEGFSSGRVLRLAIGGAHE